MVATIAIPVWSTVAIAVVLVPTLAYVLWLSYREVDIARAREEDLRTELVESEKNLQQLYGQLGAFRSVLSSLHDGAEGGSLLKQLSETDEIIRGIQRSAPDLFGQEYEVLYGLHYKDQFVMHLANAAGNLLSEREQKEIIDHAGRVDWKGLYQAAGIAPPSVMY